MRKIINLFNSCFKVFLKKDDIYWVAIRDYQNEIMYTGLVTGFNETKDYNELILSGVNVYTLYESKELYFLSKIFLSLKKGTFTIEKWEEKIK